MGTRNAGIVTVGMAALLAALTLGAPAGDAAAPPAASGVVFVVQAMPGAAYDVVIDGEAMREDVATGAVVGPIDLTAGDHDLDFVDASSGMKTATSVSVSGGSSTDVVIHRPAARTGDPVVSTYDVPMQPIGPGKARVLLAHTATVPPADVQVDGTVVFTNIANGEFAEADVPAGDHTAALFPTGATTDPILGPLDVQLPAETVTLVYAVGSPKNGSMDIVSHQERLRSDGTVAPERIETGSAGLVRHTRVHAFLAH